MKDEKPTVLVVDDEIEVLKLLRKILEANGWQVFTSPTGASAETLADKEKLDLVLLDIRLTDKSGLEVLKELKANHRELPVVVITGFGYDEELVNEAMRLGACGYVSKGVPIKELLEVINNAMTK